jgi:hypothetical protein
MSLILVLPLSATIISGTVTGGTAFTAGGTFEKLLPPLNNPYGPPNSVGRNTFEWPNLYGFDEDQNIVLQADLVADVGTTLLPAGITVASHYIFFDPRNTRSIIGTVDFDSEVLAIITSRGNLTASDFLANTGVTYLSPGARGLEGRDAVTISGTQQISFMATASSPGDYVRVLTAFSPAAVPEPASVFLFGSGLIGLSWLIRRRGRSGRLPK